MLAVPTKTTISKKVKMFPNDNHETPTKPECQQPVYVYDWAVPEETPSPPPEPSRKLIGSLVE